MLDCLQKTYFRDSLVWEHFFIKNDGFAAPTHVGVFYYIQELRVWRTPRASRKNELTVFTIQLVHFFSPARRISLKRVIPDVIYKSSLSNPP